MSEDTHVKALAAENARLRQDLERARHNAKTWHGRWVRAQAEVEGLRHRDRRTQAVVEAAVAWRASSDSYKAQTALVLAVDAYEKGPTEAPTSPLPADQPPVVAEEATDGLEAQGGAQQAAGPSRVWDKGEGPVAWLHVPERKPRVWNAGDPEPEGVERIVDRVGDEWCRIDGWWSTTDNGEDYATLDWTDLLVVWAPLTEVLPEPAADLTAKAHRIASLIDTGLGNVTKPLTPLPVVGQDGPCTCDLCETGPDKPAAEPDGEVPEASRAGEAQDRTECEDCGQRHPVGDEFPDRTEGLDAAIEAATEAIHDMECGEWAEGCTHSRVTYLRWRGFAQAAVRAASPLIERAALHAAADEIEAAMATAAGKWRWRANEKNAIHDAVRIIRDRATRTETS